MIEYLYILDYQVEDFVNLAGEEAGKETAPIAFQDSLLDQVPEFSKELLVAMMKECVVT